MTDYKLVPVEPTPEMLCKGMEAYCIEDCEVIAQGHVLGIYKAMLAAAPAVQGEPVAWIIRHPRFCGKFTDDKEIAEYWENKEQGCTAPLFLHSQPTPDVEEPSNVSYIDGVGAARRSPADCRDGVRYITVADTVYWPLPPVEAQQLHSAACGKGEFNGPNSPAPDVSALVGALEWLRGAVNCTPSPNDKYQSGTWISTRHPRIKQIDTILATHRKQGGDV